MIDLDAREARIAETTSSVTAGQIAMQLVAEVRRLLREANELRYARDEAANRANAAERERDAALTRLAEVEAQAAAMREALEWYPPDDGCPWCGHSPEHAPDCLYQQALSGDAGRALLARVARMEATLQEVAAVLRREVQPLAAGDTCDHPGLPPHSPMYCGRARMLAAVEEALKP